MNTGFDKNHDRLSILGALVAQHLPPQQIAENEWKKIVELSISQGLGPMLYWVVRQSGIEVSDPTIWQPLKYITLLTSARHMMLEHTVKRVNAALTVAGIPALWLKGIVLARTVYPRPSLRPMNDLDVLIPYEQRELALSTVQSLGYQLGHDEDRLFSSNDYLTTKLNYDYNLESNSEASIHLELHYRLLGNLDTLLSVKHLDWFWTQIQSVEVDKLAFFGLRPEAHLLYLAAHVILQHGEAESSLRQYFDIHRLVSSYVLDWNTLIDQSAVLGWTYALKRALTLAVSFFDTAVPPTVLAQLKSSQSERENVIRSVHFQGQGRIWEMIRSNLGLLSRRERISFLIRVVFPPDSYMHQRYAIPDDRPVWPHYPYRWLNQGRVIGWWIWERFTMFLKGRHENE